MTLFLSHRDISVVDGLRRRGRRSADAFLGGCLRVHPRGFRGWAILSIWLFIPRRPSISLRPTLVRFGHCDGHVY